MGVEPKLDLKKFDAGKYVFVVSIKNTFITSRLNFKWSCLNPRQFRSESNNLQRPELQYKK